MTDLGFDFTADSLLRDVDDLFHPQRTVNSVNELCALFTFCLTKLGEDTTRLSTELGSAGRIEQARLIHALTDTYAALGVHLSALGTVLIDDIDLTTTFVEAFEPARLAGEQLTSLAGKLDPGWCLLPLTDDQRLHAPCRPGQFAEKTRYPFTPEEKRAYTISFLFTASRLLGDVEDIHHPQRTVNSVNELCALLTYCLTKLGEDTTKVSTELGSAGRIEQARLVHALTDTYTALGVHLSALGTVLIDDIDLTTTFVDAFETACLAGEQLTSLAEKLDPAGLSRI
ncbi:Uncharacterised protein [Amycolatopsis camponoti]|uniref:Uncharacterized protein n=1 Tax=Amycolatopsis camponoti TaxID=2606593 RepID=A0A6I8M027_9PSEU|nr:hypothetical protein [Amycolatopsis camponoti]VVJ22734.1 Uncharacterised protein [Amycolatopsis camponoti]